ncbi:MAG: hypothetical protein RIR18_1069 [Pseudomonadota bacterium]|jgi:hypothetical protein
MSLPQYVTVNGTNYATEKLSDTAREQVANLQIVDEEIRKLQNLLGIAQTARNVYIADLLKALEAAKPAKAEKAPAKPDAKAVKEEAAEPAPAAATKKPRAKKTV